jgi:hypothetical protein
MTKFSFVALAAIFCMVASHAAQARPRDDVMAGAFHCSSIGDSRQWLDCYYGAAQPVRAALGLAPAPAAQTRLAAAPPAGTPADTATRDAVMSGAFRCNDFTDDRRWLDCYYSAAQPIRSLLGLSPAPQAPAQGGPVPHTESKTEPKAPSPQFGLPQPDNTGLAGSVDHVVSRMKSFSFDRYGIFTVTLANGQVWRQISGDTEYAHWKEPATHYAVSISRGWFGSYNFQVRGIPGLYKVRRQS